MSSTALSGTTPVSIAEHLEVLYAELAEVTGQRNAIDGWIVQIVAEIDHDHLWGATGCRSLSALVAWRGVVSPWRPTGTAPAPATVRESAGTCTADQRINCRESARRDLTRHDYLTRACVGSYPEVVNRPSARRRNAWLDNYVDRIVKRDAPDVSNLHRIADLPRLLRDSWLRAAHLSSM